MTSEAAAPTGHARAAEAAGSRGAGGLLVARSLVSLCAVATMCGAYAADFNVTHLLNPRWPPHARFHNAQTMLLATALGACALVYTWRRDPTATHLRTGILFASLYWFSNAGSIAFPGTAWTDPELSGRGDVLGLPAAALIGAAQLLLLGVALIVSRPRGSARDIL